MSLEVAGSARSTFFYHQARLAVPDPQAGLKAAVRDVFEENKGRYWHRPCPPRAGARRVAGREEDSPQADPAPRACLPGPAPPPLQLVQGEVGTVAENLLGRDFTATVPNQKRVTDVTEFSIGERKIYLSPVMDLFDRPIIAYSVSDSPNLALTNSSLTQALAARAPGDTPAHALLVHSDQGFQYQHPSWWALLTDAGATRSMSRKGNCLDNTVTENFFGHLKHDWRA
ncbi:IS3 family transposase [Kribbella sp. NBC_00359]|uniref:IS3 family transposase n=1 Tax=Kribbella sp. NBC_00359 TaxID=2975966 RepID=UPI002E24D63F